MTTHTVLLLALAAAAAAAPYGSTIQLCSTECPVAAAKLAFTPGKTYSYTYTGKSQVQLKGVDGGVVDTRWEEQVLLTVLGPCDLAISFKGSKVDGKTGLSGSDKLERYPLVVAMTDGRVQRVCSHPDDDTWAINMKKGVVSALQISLPSLSISNSGLNFTETDVLGTCPTYYEVQAEGAKVLVKKEKNHRLCQEHYPTPDEIDLPHLKGPLPIQESQSICRQEIDSGIISSVVCEDKKVIRPSYGMYKYVEAKQESTLRLTSSDVSAPDTISRIGQDELVPRSLRYDYETAKKDPSLVPELEQTLTYLCEITKDGVEADVAAHLSKAVHLMRRIPEQGFNEIYTKVHNKQICPQHSRLESMYKDAIAFVHEPESVPVMVKELVEGRATGTLAALYSTGFYLVPRPDVKAIRALEPLFKSNADLSSAKLAAASMVNTYCRHKPHCYEESPVRNLAQALKQKIEEDLSSSSREETQKQALSALKSLGNMGVMTPETADKVILYMENENKKVSTRVAAAQAFRLTKCQRLVTQKLVQYALRPGQNTEVRIAAYLAAVRCANYEDLQHIVTKISYEENTQVRGFILSHLINLQQSDAPGKQRLRYLLTNILLPQDFETDIRKYSQNLDLSYFSPSAAGLESNMIYAPGSMLPRSLGVNLTAAPDGTGIPINIADVGARVEGLEPIIAQLLGPASYLKTSSYSKIFNDLVSFIQQNWSTIKQELEVAIRERRTVDDATIESIISKLYGPQYGQFQADFFARFLGQEINYASLSEHLQDINMHHLVEASVRCPMQMLSSLKNVNLDKVKAVQLGVDYSFPTIQGTPLKITSETMAVAGIKMETNLNGLFSGQGGSESKLKILPSFSVETHGFIGYDAYISKSGLKMNTTVSSSNGVAIKVGGQSSQELQIEVDIPDKMEIIRVHSETFLMKHHENTSQTTRSCQPSMQDIRIRRKSCFTALESVFGIKMCYDVNVPDIFRANASTTGIPSTGYTHLNKTESTITGYKIAVRADTETQDKKYAAKVSVAGSSSPKEADVEVNLKRDRESYLAEVKLLSSVTHGKVRISLVNRPEQKSLQTDFSFMKDGVEFLQALRIEIKKTHTSYGMKYDMDVYWSPSNKISQESQIFTGLLKLDYMLPNMVMEISAETKNILKQYILFSLQAVVDFKYYDGVPIPVQLRQFELTVAINSWMVTSFFRNSRASSQEVIILRVSSLLHQREMLINLQADLPLQGTPAVDFIQQLFIDAKIGQTEYKLQQRILYQETRGAISLQLTRESDNVKLLQIHVEKDAHEIKFLFWVQMLEYMAPIKVVASAVQQGQDYNAEAIIMYGQQTLVQLHGPVTYINSPTLAKVGANIKINNVYQFIYSFEFEENKQNLLLEIKKEAQVLLSFETYLKTPSSQGPSLQARITYQFLLDGSMEVFVSENVIHISTNTLWLPHSPSPRRVKAFLDINWSQKQAQMMVLWNADKDSSQKIALDVIIVPESGRPAEATLHVKLMLLNRAYHSNVKVVVPFLLQRHGERNSIQMEVETPEQKKWMLEVGVQQQESNAAKVDLTFKSVNNNNYRLTSDLQWQRLDGPLCFDAQTRITLISPQNKRSLFSMNAKHHYSPQQHIIHFTMEASTPSTQPPLKISFSLENKDYSYVTKLQSEVSSPETLFTWQLEIYPEGGIKHLENAIDLTAIRNVLKTLSSMVGLRGSSPLVTSAYQKRNAYGYRYTRSSSGTHSFIIEQPSRTVEAHATYSPSKMGIEFYRNRAESEAKYEMSGEYMDSMWGGNSRLQGRMSHPKLSRDMTAAVESTRSGSGHQGSFELDVFPDTADKITGSLTSILRANNTIVIEANLFSRVLQVKPKVMMEVSWAAHTAAFNFTFQETPLSPESLKEYAKYDRISRNHAAVTFQLAGEGSSTMDVSGVIEPRNGPHCAGFALLANARTSLLGNFAVNSTVCKPMFLEVVFKKQNSEKIYKAAIGKLFPYKAEISLAESDRYQTWYKYISLIGIRLETPRRIKIASEYRENEMASLKDLVLNDVYRITEAVLTWTDRVCNEIERQARQKGVPFPTPQIHQLLQEISHDIGEIYLDLIYNDILYEWEALKQLLQGPTATFVKESIFQLLQSMAHMEREFAVYIMQQFKPAINKIIEAVKEVARWVQTGEEPEIVRRLVEDLERSAIYQIIQTHIIEPIKETYPQQYQATKEVVAKVIDTFRHDLLIMQHKVLASPTLHRIIRKIEDLSQPDTMRQTLEWWESQVVQSLVTIAPEPGVYHVGIQIPLYRPIYSLTQLVNMTMQSPPTLTQKILLSAESFRPIPVTKIMETYYDWVPRNLSTLPLSLNRSALGVSDTEILTFDGVLLRMPRSPCKVLLGPDGGSRYTWSRMLAHPVRCYCFWADVVPVYMSHPQPSQAPGVPLQGGSTKAIMKPNMEVNVNGRPVHGRQTVGDVVVKVSPDRVALVSPILGVQFMKQEHVVMVNASTWVFNHTRGLLGLYDNERANDRMMSNGRNASSLHDLVNSWQESPSCPTPSISPVDPTRVPLKERVLCDFLFFQMKPCMPVVSHKPFLQSCRIHSRPFEVAGSYHSLCRAQGVMFPLSLF
uniref:Vitellogenin n=2 Tax=Charybdis TaxID=65692 RepID=Q5XXZ5_CHAFE|nr:vitellogenin [Charybdis feriata]